MLELSSFQLELFDSALAWGSLAHVGPDVAALLNITPNHLDRHPEWLLMRRLNSIYCIVYPNRRKLSSVLTIP